MATERHVHGILYMGGPYGSSSTPHDPEALKRAPRELPVPTHTSQDPISQWLPLPNVDARWLAVHQSGRLTVWRGDALLPFRADGPRSDEVLQQAHSPALLLPTDHPGVSQRQLPADTNRLHYLESLQLYLSWRQGGRRLGLLTSEFEVLDELESPEPVHAIAHPTGALEIILCGNQELHRLAFRRGRHLEFRTAYRPQCEGSPDKPLRHLVLDSDEETHQRLYVAIGNCVAIHRCLSGESVAAINDIFDADLSCIYPDLKEHVLLVASRRGAIAVINMNNWSRLATWVSTTAPIVAIYEHRLLPSAILALAEDATLTVWHYHCQDCILQRQLPEQPKALYPLPHHPSLLLLLGTNTSHMFRLNILYRLYSLMFERITSLARRWCAPDEAHLCTLTHRQQAIVLDAQDQACLLETERMPFLGPTRSISLLDSQDLWCFCSTSGQIRFYSTQKGADELEALQPDCLWAPSLPPNGATCIATLELARQHPLPETPDPRSWRAGFGRAVQPRYPMTEAWRTWRTEQAPPPNIHAGVLVGSEDGHLRLIDLRTQRLVEAFPAIHAAGLVAVTADVSQPPPVRFQGTAPPASLPWHVASYDAEGALVLWALTPMAIPPLSPDANFEATEEWAAHPYITVTQLRVVFLLDRIYRQVLHYPHLITCARHEETARHVVSVLDVAQDTTISHHVLDDHDSRVIGLDLNPHLDLMVTAEDAGILKLWCVSRNSLLATIQLDSPVQGIAIQETESTTPCIVLATRGHLWQMPLLPFLPRRYLRGILGPGPRPEAAWRANLVDELHHPERFGRVNLSIMPSANGHTQVRHHRRSTLADTTRHQMKTIELERQRVASQTRRLLDRERDLVDINLRRDKAIETTAVPSRTRKAQRAALKAFARQLHPRLAVIDDLHRQYDEERLQEVVQASLSTLSDTDMQDLRAAVAALPELSSEEEDDGVGLMDLLKKNPVINLSSSEEDEEEEESPRRRRRRRAAVASRGFQMLDERERPAKAQEPPPANESANDRPPPPIKSPKPTRSTPSAPKFPPVAPPLPRYLSQFREKHWFKFRYPRAVPSTFDFLRPAPSEDEVARNVLAQIPYRAVVTFLAGSELSFSGPPVRSLLSQATSTEDAISIVESIGVLSVDSHTDSITRAAIRRTLLAALDPHCFAMHGLDGETDLLWQHLRQQADQLARRGAASPRPPVASSMAMALDDEHNQGDHSSEVGSAMAEDGSTNVVSTQPSVDERQRAASAARELLSDWRTRLASATTLSRRGSTAVTMAAPTDDRPPVHDIGECDAIDVLRYFIVQNTERPASEPRARTQTPRLLRNLDRIARAPLATQSFLPRLGYVGRVVGLVGPWTEATCPNQVVFDVLQLPGSVGRRHRGESIELHRHACLRCALPLMEAKKAMSANK
ncbi:uncharacterized protein MONBRDRAFT_6232 [Monosiga brevicollis MX1]|uniref:Uncharacterized protein n=1 Tax=Monosiga brevicollis TaxID=81824 RepID=A9UT81_MONBE|nr:uncharacterized protein MONBRDRAFT_6232 [Monosiga brevicollis MX1]EDQ91447.1 predicted protein [Monosiga brevicollis MX1]|eukprot:XP_001743869.1 hypothetical protein [Monosiga brevicollis MX1]